MRKAARFYNPIRQAVLERDGYKCQLCGKQKKLLVHHIDNNGFKLVHIKGYSLSTLKTMNNELDNLITLCIGCHLSLHVKAAAKSRVRMEKREKIKELRNSGNTYQKIADMLGVSRQRIHQVIMYEHY